MCFQAAIAASPSLDVEMGSVESCGTYNLYQLPNRPFDRIPIYDQGELSTCYAYTASQMIDFWRFNHDSQATSLTSPLWTALIHKVNVPIHWNPDSLDFSRMTWVFKSLEKNGICEESVVNRAVEKLRNGNVLMTEPDIMYFFQTLWDEYQAHAKLFASNELVYELAYQKTAGLPYFQGKLVNSIKESFHFMTHYFKGQRLETLMSEVFSECRDQHLLPIQLPERESLGFAFSSNQKIMKRINTVLGQGQPLGVGYCSTLLDKGPGFRGIHLKPRMLGMAVNNNECGAHYSMIVGQRKADSGCQYLIRNTYGTHFWTDRWSCFCEDKASKGRYEECRASSADAKNLRVLGCWVNADDLASNVYDLTYFEN
jgi:hypothetical protein